MPYTNWLTRTTNLSAVFFGDSGHTYSFYSVARDNVGNIEEAPEEPDAVITVPAINEPPVADANGPYAGFVGSPLTFDGTGSYDLDGTIVSYEWDLDDDGEFDDATGATPAKTWDAPYSGNISLKVTDNDGATDIDNTTLTVEEAVDTILPTIESVTLYPANTIAGSIINISVHASDNVGVVEVTADGNLLTYSSSSGLWNGSISASSSTGSYTVTIRAKDAANNIAETTASYNVVSPQGGVSVAVIPKISTVARGSSIVLNIKRILKNPAIKTIKLIND
jgi:hypothetical protein